jgi:hypothetical protein
MGLIPVLSPFIVTFFSIVTSKLSAVQTFSTSMSSTKSCVRYRRVKRIRFAFFFATTISRKNGEKSH